MPISSPEISTSSQRNKNKRDASGLSLNPNLNLPKILDNTYYKIYKHENAAISAACSSCANVISRSVSSTGKFFSHIRRKHADQFEKCKQYCKSQNSVQYDGVSAPKKQQTLPCAQLVSQNMVSVGC